MNNLLRYFESYLGMSDSINQEKRKHMHKIHINL